MDKSVHELRRDDEFSWMCGSLFDHHFGPQKTLSGEHLFWIPDGQKRIKKVISIAHLFHATPPPP